MGALAEFKRLVINFRALKGWDAGDKAAGKAHKSPTQIEPGADYSCQADDPGGTRNGFWHGWATECGPDYLVPGTEQGTVTAIPVQDEI